MDIRRNGREKRNRCNDYGGTVSVAEGKSTELYDAVVSIVDRGNNAEIRKNRSGGLDVFEVRRHKIV